MRKLPFTAAGIVPSRTNNRVRIAGLVTDGVEILEILPGYAAETSEINAQGLFDVLGLDDLHLDADQIRGTAECKVITSFAENDREFGGNASVINALFYAAMARYWQADAPLAFVSIGPTVEVYHVDVTQTEPQDQIVAFEAGTGWRSWPQDKAFVSTLGTDAIPPVEDPYFSRLPPKRVQKAEDARLKDVLAQFETPSQVFEAYIAAAIHHAMQFVQRKPQQVVISFQEYPVLNILDALEAALSVPCISLNDLGLLPEYEICYARAFTAARILRHLPTSGPTTTGAKTWVGGGHIL